MLAMKITSICLSFVNPIKRSRKHQLFRTNIVSFNLLYVNDKKKEKTENFLNLLMISRKRYHIIRILGWWTSRFNGVEFRSLIIPIGVVKELDVPWNKCQYINELKNIFGDTRKDISFFFFWAKSRWKRKLYSIWPVEHWLKTATTLSLLLLVLFFFFILTTDNNRDEELLVCCRFLFSFIAFRSIAETFFYIIFSIFFIVLLLI
jgi:hypothetical protein